jgi:hypothetical protein
LRPTSGLCRVQLNGREDFADALRHVRDAALGLMVEEAVDVVQDSRCQPDPRHAPCQRLKFRAAALRDSAPRARASTHGQA